MNILSTASKEKLVDCNKILRNIVYAVLPLMDIGVTCGHRGQSEQNQLYIQNKTQLQYPRSKHNTLPSDAVDLVIYDKQHGYLWGNQHQLEKIADSTGTDVVTVEKWIFMQYARLDALMQAEASRQGHALRWGGKWDAVDGILSITFVDLFHWEVV